MSRSPIRSRQLIKDIKRVADTRITHRVAKIISVDVKTGRATVRVEGASRNTEGVSFPGGAGGIPEWAKPDVPVIVQAYSNSPIGLQIVAESSVAVADYPIDAEITAGAAPTDSILSGFVVQVYPAWANIGLHGGLCIGSAGAGGGNSYLLQGNVNVFSGLLLGTSCDDQSGGNGFCRNNQGADGALGNGIARVGEAGYLDQTFTVLRVPPVSALAKRRVDMVTLKVDNAKINGQAVPLAKLTVGTEATEPAVPPLPSPLAGEFLLAYIVVHYGCKDFVAVAAGDSTVASQCFIAPPMVRLATAGVVPAFTVPQLTTYPTLTLTPAASYGAQLTGVSRTVKAALDFGPSGSNQGLACYLSNNLAFNRTSTDADPRGGVAVTTVGTYQREVDCRAAVLDGADSHWKTNFYFDVPAQGLGASRGHVTYGFVGTSLLPDYSNMLYRTQCVYWGD